MISPLSINILKLKNLDLLQTTELFMPLLQALLWTCSGSTKTHRHPRHPHDWYSHSDAYNLQSVFIQIISFTVSTLHIWVGLPSLHGV